MEHESDTTRSEPMIHAHRTDILLIGINAKYIHASFGLRYLLANLGSYRSRASILEFDLNTRIPEMVERALQHHPFVIGIGVYIWNVNQVRSFVYHMKQISPETRIVLGGPEVSFEQATITWLAEADHVISGEADLAFHDLCAALLNSHDSKRQPEKWIQAPPPDVNQLTLPYPYYNELDIRHRIVYVEASRGCPFTCEFCLSALEIPVRAFPLEPFLESLQELYDRGLRHFKFVDRTFNLNIATGMAILKFFEMRYEPGLFLHFEMIPDRLPDPLREIIATFPSGCIQFEIGIQSLNKEVSKNIHRRQNQRKLEENIQYLRKHTGVHLHVDLIAGLPGEDMRSFARGFNQLLRLDPHEIQLGILKRLKGTPMTQRETSFSMIYDEEPPYEILQTSHMNFLQIQRIKRFARYWDLIGNSGNFTQTLKLLLGGSKDAFSTFMHLSDWIYQTTEGQRHGIALTRLLDLIFTYCTGTLRMEADIVATTAWKDYHTPNRNDIPKCLRPYIRDLPNRNKLHPNPASSAQKRQVQHQQTRS